MRISQSIRQFLQKPYFFLFSILLFFTPLVMASNTNELFEFPKMFFVYIFGLFIITLFLSDLINNPNKLKMPSPLVWIFVVITIISTIFSSHFYTSLFGYYTRFNDGLLSYFIFFGLYIVALNKLDEEDFEKLLKIVIFTIIPISIYGLAQFFLSSNILLTEGRVDRVFSTFGQPNWLAQYLSILLPICLYFSLLDTKNNFKKWFSVYVLGFYCFWLTFSMSGILGFLVSIFFLSILLMKEKFNLSLYPGKKKKNKVFLQDIKIRVTLIILISIFISVLNIGTFGDKLNDVFIDIKKQISEFSITRRVYAQEEETYKLSDPGFIRFALWKSSFNLITSSPKIFFLGSGPETYPYSFQPHRSEELNYSSEWDFVFNKPHNYYIEIWAESGIFAFVVYILVIYQLFRKSQIFLLPAIISFAVTNIFGWPVVSTSLLFWFFLAMIESQKDGVKI